MQQVICTDDRSLPRLFLLATAMRRPLLILRISIHFNRFCMRHKMFKTSEQSGKGQKKVPNAGSDGRIDKHP